MKLEKDLGFGSFHVQIWCEFFSCDDTVICRDVLPNLQKQIRKRSYHETNEASFLYMIKESN